MRRPIILVTAACAVALGCHRRAGQTLYVPGSATSMEVNLTFPLGAVSGTAGSFATTCSGAQSLVLSVDVSSAGTPSWRHRFLFDTSGTLWGCASGACATGTIRTAIPPPTRLMVEGYDLPPASLPTASTANVLCRGVADLMSGMGTISSSPIPTPPASPVPSPPAPVENLVVTATIPMLRVGNVNGTFTTAGPSSGASTAAAFLPRSGTRDRDGGAVLLAGDFNSNQALWTFDPKTIKTTQLPFQTAYPRYMAISMAFLDSAGVPSIALTGGSYDYSKTAAQSVEVVRLGVQGTQIVAAYPDHDLMQHSVVYVPDHVESGQTLPIIAMFGGCYNSGTTTFFDQYEFFYPRAPIDTTFCLPGTQAGRAGICRPGSGHALSDGGRCGMGAGYVMTPAGRRVLLAMGVDPASPSTGVSASYLFNPDTQTTIGPVQTFGTTAMAGPTSVVITTNQLGFFAGNNGSASATTSWVYFRSSDSRLVEASTAMKVARLMPGMTRLLDGRILAVGGNNAPLSDTVELFTPATSGDGAFAFAADLNGSCATGYEVGCVRESISRFSPAATTIVGSSTWLNGAVLIANGGPTPSSGHSTEIFVPAYECSGDRPIDVFGNLVSGVDFCDLGRPGGPISDPEAP